MGFYTWSKAVYMGTSDPTDERSEDLRRLPKTELICRRCP
jgi:hypothetical protein